jgi:hypothetical protein
MTERNELTPALSEARLRRRTLHEALVQLEMAISSPAAGRVPEWTGQVRKDLAGVKAAFEQHVEVTEKPGGLYEEIMTKAPRLVNNVDRLHEEHPTIAERVGEMFDRVESGDIEQDAWPVDNARDDLQRLIGLVARHRQRGADLVWEAYNVDIGGPE